jgi:hypothetical protein
VCTPNPASFFVEGGGERHVHIQLPDNAAVTRTFTVLTTATDP